MIVQCKNCNNSFNKHYSQIKKTKNNFCSKSCAATFNNKKFPKRKAAQKYCKKCSVAIKSTRTVCLNCCPNYVDWSKVTLQDIKDKANYQIYAQVRDNARKVYRKSNKPKLCVECGYKLHYDVCHIKDISDFDKNTPISVINSLDNLISLCKNHHWEFDNGHLKLKL